LNNEAAHFSSDEWSYPCQSDHVELTQIPPASLFPNTAIPTIEHEHDADDGITAQANEPTSRQKTASADSTRALRASLSLRHLPAKEEELTFFREILDRVVGKLLTVGKAQGYGLKVHVDSCHAPLGLPAIGAFPRSHPGREVWQARAERERLYFREFQGTGYLLGYLSLGIVPPDRSITLRFPGTTLIRR